MGITVAVMKCNAIVRFELIKYHKATDTRLVPRENKKNIKKKIKISKTKHPFMFTIKTRLKTTEKLRYKCTIYKIMVSYSKLCILHFSVNVLRPACVDRKQNKVLAVIC